MERDVGLPRKHRRTIKVLFEQLQGQGYEGGYDAVRRHVSRWREAEGHRVSQAFVPLTFASGEAYQFDWSHEQLEIDGMPMTVKTAHMRLCHSRMVFCFGYPRETQEMVFDAHQRGFAFFGGSCGRGIYDNMKTAVNKVLRGKQRELNSRFEQMCTHYLVDPTLCTPAAGWEKGQVEKSSPSGTYSFFIRQMAFSGALRSTTPGCWSELLVGPRLRLIRRLRTRRSGRSSCRSVKNLIKPAAPFDGYRIQECRVFLHMSGAVLITTGTAYPARRLDRRRRSRRTADHISVIRDGRVLAVHARRFGREKTVYDPWQLRACPGA